MKRLYYDISNVELLEEASNDSQFATAKIEVFNTGLSRHNTDCDLETLTRTAFTIYEKPVIFEMDYTMGDFGSHSRFTIPAGFVIPKSESFYKRPDGRTALVVLAKIWKKYSGKFLQVFKDTGSDKKKVSAEIEIYESEVSPNGIMNLKEFAYSAVCVLGDYVTEASPDSSIQMITFAKDEIKEYERIYKKEFSLKYPELDFTVPDEVKVVVKAGLENYAKTRQGGNSVILSLSRFINKNEKVPPEKVKTITKLLSKYRDGENESSYFFALLGGEVGFVWFSNLSKKMAELDNTRKSYFSVNYEQTDRKENEGNMDDEKVKPIDGEKPETPAQEEEMAVAETEEVEEPEEEKMSLSSYIDVNAALEFLEAEGESDVDAAGKILMAVEELKKPEKQDFGVILAGMCSKAFCMKGRMSLMAEEKNVYMAENESLKEYKMGIEKQQKEFAVDATLAELSSRVIIPEDAMTEMKAKSMEFSLDKIDEWKTYCKAKSFDFAPVKTESGGDGIIRSAFVWNIERPKVDNDLWKS